MEIQVTSSRFHHLAKGKMGTSSRYGRPRTVSTPKRSQGQCGVIPMVQFESALNRIASQRRVLTERTLRGPATARLINSALAALVSVVAATDAGAALEPKRPSQLVLAFTSGSTSCVANMFKVDTRVLPDGSKVPFEIPEGKIFILTSYEFSHNEALPDGAQVFAGPVVVNGDKIQHLSRAAGIMKDFNAFGGAILPVGIAIRPPAGLCMDGSSTLANTSLRILGYFASDS